MFKFLIKKFNFITPGKEDDEVESKLYTRKDLNEVKERGNVSQLIVEGLGGVDNIKNLDCCATRLRITVFESEKVADSLLKQSGASGVIKKGDGIQVIYGPRVTVIKSEVEEYISEIKPV